MFREMKIILFLLIFNIALVLSHVNDDFLEFVKSSGYESEAHEVETEDGYLLTIHRILPRMKSENLTKNPVFLMHGFIMTSGDFVMTGKDKALGFLLADNGYDVWLGNARGNKYSTKHKNLSTESPEFWNFSFHEIGFYDLPAMIDYMLNTTKASKAFYVGHSQGTTVPMVMLSLRPEYNDKIIQAHLLSPVVFMTNFPHRLAKFLKPEIDNGLLDEFSYLNFQGIWNISKKLRDNYCGDNSNGEFSCAGLVMIMFFFLGPNRKGVEMDTNILKIMDHHVSPKSSVNQIKHFSKLIENKEFQMLNKEKDFFSKGNSTVNENYPLENVKIPVYLYHATEDLLLNISDAKRLKNMLSNVKLLRIIPNWNHCDFNYSKHARKVLYRDILKAMNSYETQNNFEV